MCVKNNKKMDKRESEVPILSDADVAKAEQLIATTEALIAEKEVELMTLRIMGEMVFGEDDSTVTSLDEIFKALHKLKCQVASYKISVMFARKMKNNGNNGNNGPDSGAGGAGMGCSV